MSKTLRTNEFSNVAGYEINIQKAIVFLYTSNEHVETDNKNYNTI